MTKPKSKHWCITINNPDKDSHSSYWDAETMTYMVLGTEWGKSNTKHYQGYVVFKIRHEFTFVKKVFVRAHLEIKRGKNSEASLYCKKDDKFTEFGDLPPDNSGAQGTKRKWDEIRSNAQLGKFDDVPDDIYVRYLRNIHGIYALHPPKLNVLSVKHNYWLVAPTGFGKSTEARRRWPDYYDKAPNKWWTGYQNESAVICDDYGPDQCKYLGWYMKRWADKFPFPAETKGSQITIRPKNIIVTSQYTIEECFPYDGKLQAAIKGRFEVIQLRHYNTRIVSLFNVD